MIDRPLDSHLPAQRVPIEEQRATWIGVEFVTLATGVVRVEDEATVVEALDQHHANRRRAVERRRGERRGLRHPDASSLSVPKPDAELTQRAWVDVLLAQRLAVIGHGITFCAVTRSHSAVIADGFRAGDY